jgi:hypothetical protein
MPRPSPVAVCTGGVEAEIERIARRIGGGFYIDCSVEIRAAPIFDDALTNGRARS